MIESGVIKFGAVNVEEGTYGARINQDKVVERNMWDGSTLTPRLLSRYIQEELLHKPIFEAMVEVRKSYGVGSWDLEFVTFGLDPNTLQERLKEQWSD